MALPSPLYIAWQGVETLFNSKDTATALSGGYVKFFVDPDNSTPKDVYILSYLPSEDTYTFVNVGSVIPLNVSGAFSSPTDGTDVQVYAYPYQNLPDDPEGTGDVQLYFMEIYDANGILQFVRYAQPANVVSTSSVITTFSDSANEVSNPQFAQVLFSSPTTFTVSGNTTYQIAPDWFIDVTTASSGSLTVTQVPIDQQPLTGNPPYVLGIDSSGLSSITLRQRFVSSPRLLLNSFVNGSFIASSAMGVAVPMTMTYDSLDGTVHTILIDGVSTSTDGTFSTVFNNTVEVTTAGSSSITAPSGYSEIKITFTPNVQVYISNVQVISVQNELSSAEFMEESYARQVDHLFHYYQPQLNFKPIPSLLTGWDFPLNPAQLGSTIASSSFTTPLYAWDQTIIGSAVGNLAIARNTTTGGMSITTANDLEAIFLLQYLQGGQALKTTLSNLAVNIDAYATTHPNVAVNVYLFYSSNSGTIPAGSAAAPGVIGTIAYGTMAQEGQGVFTLTAANWSPILQPQGQASTAALPYNVHTDTQFTGFNGKANYQSASSTQNFAIVVTFGIPTSGTVININSISCVPGDIPTRPAPQTYDEVLRECQYYYEQSYVPGTAPGMNTTTAQYVFPMSASCIGGSNPYALWVNSFDIVFKVGKRTTPNFTLYTPSTLNTNNSVYWAGLVNATPLGGANLTANTNWTLTASINNLQAISAGAILVGGSGPGVTILTAYGALHYTIDARLGVV